MAKRTTRKRTSGGTTRKTTRAAAVAAGRKQRAGRSTGAQKAAKGKASVRGSRPKAAGSRKAAAQKAPARKAAPARNAAAARKAAASPKLAPRKGSARKVPSRKRVEEPSALAKAATAFRGTVAGAVAAVKQTISSRPPDAIALLETDHRRMQKLLAQGEKTTPQAARRRIELLDTLTAELRAHELVEERVLYPALEAHPEARDVALEGFQEHHVADVIVEELHRVAADDEQWSAKFTVLKENLEHHIDEEEGGMFRTARGLFSQDELDAMGAKMAAMKAGQNQD